MVTVELLHKENFWQNVLPEFIDTQLQSAARLAHLMLVVRSMSAMIKAIFISDMSP